jgi:hypothetical protein
MIPTRCAVVRLSDGLVLNTIVATPSDVPPDDCQIIEVMNGQRCSIGWTWDGQNFIEPLPEQFALDIS